MENPIKNVLICGLGAIGSIYAKKISNNGSVTLRVLVDNKRLLKYAENPIVLNGNILDLDYILPEDTSFMADLIIIATKFNGLCEAVQNIRNFVKSDTIILSLLNGITSEEYIAKKYGYDKVLYSFYIGHSVIREANEITQNGDNTIVFGVKEHNDYKISRVKNFFDSCKINYKISEDIIHDLWQKFLLNLAANQTSAILKMSFGQMQTNHKFLKFMKSIINEVLPIAKAEGVKNTDDLEFETMLAFNSIHSSGKTSMLQDILANQKTEVEMFAGTIVELGRKHNIATPINDVILQMIEIMHENIDNIGKNQ